jgi:hypothetical protein
LQFIKNGQIIAILQIATHKKAKLLQLQFIKTAKLLQVCELQFKKNRPKLQKAQMQNLIIINCPNFVRVFSSILQFTANARYIHSASKLPLRGKACL